jgi:hypothetical protein
VDVIRFKWGMNLNRLVSRLRNKLNNSAPEQGGGRRTAALAKIRRSFLFEKVDPAKVFENCVFSSSLTSLQGGRPRLFADSKPPF